ncbi:MAG: PH domain-containing protein [Rhodothermales bacterium]|nr:PH domain-containing protein [Rhodothermales bacterium]
MEDPTEAPAVLAPKDDLKPLDPAVVRVWGIKIGLGMALLCIAALIVELIWFVKGTARIPFVISGSVLLLSVVMAIFIPRLRYRFWRYELRDQELFLRRGIINRVSTIVPLRRIQHLDVSQDIIEKEFALGKLIVHTAGTRSSDVIVPGLAIDVAETLRDTVKDYILEDTL